MNNNKDADISFEGFGFTSGATAEYAGMMGRQSSSMLFQTAVVSDDDGNVSIDSKSIEISDQPSATVKYLYEQISAPENLIFKVKFKDFPTHAMFEIDSDEFLGFKINKQDASDVSLNANAKKSFKTGLELSLWFGNETLSDSASVQLKFYKVEHGEGGIDKQVIIAETTLKLKNSQ